MSDDSSTEDPKQTLSGSCLCGGVTYRCSSPLGPIARCYCAQCRKASGAECATNADVQRGSFRVLTGEELLREFESSPGQLRVFCGRCGSPVFKRYADDPDRIRIRLGLLDVDVEDPPRVQVFISQKLGLTRIDTTIRSFDRTP